MSDLISAGNSTQTRRPTASATEAGSRSKRFADPVIAYAILRLSFGVNIMLHGASRLLAGGSAFNAYLDRYFEHTPLMSKSFLHVFGALLPAAEAILGLLLVLGIVTRVALIAGGLLMTALVFGTNLAQDWNVAGLQLIYCFIYYYLLAHRRELNRISLDAWLLQKKRGSAWAKRFN
jgi:thiosulfate dehydrogenase (quinone) large subunit